MSHRTRRLLAVVALAVFAGAAVVLSVAGSGEAALPLALLAIPPLIFLVDDLAGRRRRRRGT